MGLERVLLAVGAGDADRTDRLAQVTTDIAAPADATVVLGHAFTEEGFEEASADLHFDDADETAAATVASRLSSIRALRRRFEDADVDVRLDARIGDPGNSIVALATDVDADLVVVSGRKRSPTGKAMFGSTAQTVLLEAPCPVTFVRVD
jgi:nucleotide-binding universal stress UspA family protein